MTTTSEMSPAVAGPKDAGARWLMLVVLLAWQFMALLDAGLGDDALRAGLVFAPCAVAFGLCGYFWRRLPARWHPYLTPAGCLAGAAGYLGVAATLHSGGSGGFPLQVCLVTAGAGLTLAFGSLYLTLDTDGVGDSAVSATSGHAISVTLCWVALATAFGVLAAIPLTRTVLAARRGAS